MPHQRIWLLTGAKPGDNAQVEHLIEFARLPFEHRRIVLKSGYDLAKPRYRASLHHVDLDASDKLAPPWPDLILTVGRRMAMVALWIKEQSQGRTKLALIGWPKSEADQFDLIVVPIHYRIEPRPNVHRIGLPLLGIDPKHIAAERERWRPQFGRLARPLTVVLCGGSVSTHSFDPETARGMFKTIVGFRDGGSLQVTTSRRTATETADAIAKVLPSDAGFHRWDQPGTANPYVGLLAHGDRFIVTGDSVSMLVEVARLGKPLAIAPLRPINRTVNTILRRTGLPAAITRIGASGVQIAIDRLWSLIGLEASGRDFTLLHDLMYQKGWAVPLGTPFKIPTEPPADDSVSTAALLRNLLEMDHE